MSGTRRPWLIGSALGRGKPGVLSEPGRLPPRSLPSALALYSLCFVLFVVRVVVVTRLLPV
jgi:hypothetical protein